MSPVSLPFAQEEFVTPTFQVIGVNLQTETSSFAERSAGRFTPKMTEYKLVVVGGKIIIFKIKRGDEGDFVKQIS